MKHRKSVYVALSECKEVIKVGISSDIKTRIDSLKTDNGLGFKLLFASEEVDTKEAEQIEKETTQKFKKYVIQGNEWYRGIKPIVIVEFLINEINLKPSKIKTVDITYPSWTETYSNYKNYKEGKEITKIKEKPSKGLYSIQYINEDRIECIGFCNYGDAKKFYLANKQAITSASELIKDLYKTEPSLFYSQLKIPIVKNIYSLRKEVLETEGYLSPIIKLIFNIYQEETKENN